MTHVAPPDGGWGLVVLAGAFVSYAIADGWSYSFGVVYPDLLAQFGAGRGRTALIGALLYGVPLLVSPAVCALTAVYGCRAVAIAGGAITTGYFVATYFATSVTQLCALTGVVAGVGLAMVYIPTLVAVTNYFEKWRGVATAVAVTGSGVGAFVFPVIIDWLMRLYGWRGMMLIFGAIALHLVAAGALYRPLPTLRPSPVAVVCDADVIVTEGGVSLGYARRLRRELCVLYTSMLDRSLLHHAPYLLFCASAFVLFLVFSVPYVYLVDHVVESSDGRVTLPSAVLLLSVIGAARTAGQLALGYVGDRWRRHALLVYAMTVMAAGVGTAVVPLVVRSYTALILYAVVFGVGASATYVLQMLCLVQLVGLARSTSAFGVFQLVQGVATTVGTPLAGTRHGRR